MSEPMNSHGPLIGRVAVVTGVLVAAEYVAGPVGHLLAGPAVDAFGDRAAFLGLAVALLLVALGTTLLPSLRLLGDLPDAPPDQVVSAPWR